MHPRVVASVTPFQPTNTAFNPENRLQSTRTMTGSIGSQRSRRSSFRDFFSLRSRSSSQNSSPHGLNRHYSNCSTSTDCTMSFNSDDGSISPSLDGSTQAGSASNGSDRQVPRDSTKDSHPNRFAGRSPLELREPLQVYEPPKRPKRERLKDAIFWDDLECATVRMREWISLIGREEWFVDRSQESVASSGSGKWNRSLDPADLNSLSSQVTRCDVQPRATAASLSYPQTLVKSTCETCQVRFIVRHYAAVTSSLNPGQ
jgi:hypothetical protein